MLLRGKPCYVRTVLRRSCVCVRHHSSNVTISVTMTTAVFLERTPSLLLRQASRTLLSTKLNGVTKQSNLSSNSALIPVNMTRCTNTYKRLSASGRSLGCVDTWNDVRCKSDVNNKQLHDIILSQTYLKIFPTELRTSASRAWQPGPQRSRPDAVPLYRMWDLWQTKGFCASIIVRFQGWYRKDPLIL